MNAFKIIFFATTILALCYGETTTSEQNKLAIEAPAFFPDQPSPLLKPDESLQKKEYFDFLSTLYRHDKTKAGLFEPKVAPATPVGERKKRTIIFRPLFVYRQQQIRRAKARARARARRRF